MAGPQINDFLQAFSGDAKYCLSIPVLWTVSIDGVTESAINSVLSDAGQKWQAKIAPNSMTKSGTILPAQAVMIPQESSNFSAMVAGDSYGGFLPGYAMTSRADFLSRSFSVNFLETRQDLEHEYFRPWQIAIGIKGLIERGVNLKATITVKQYTNDGQLRKGYRFKRAFPTAVEGFTMDYDNTDYPIKSVTFACENYEQLLGEPNATQSQKPPTPKPPTPKPPNNRLREIQKEQIKRIRAMAGKSYLAGEEVIPGKPLSENQKTAIKIREAMQKPLFP